MQSYTSPYPSYTPYPPHMPPAQNPEESKDKFSAQITKNEIPKEMLSFALTPEESRKIYGYPLQIKNHPNTPIKEGMLYVGHDNGYLKYWIRTPLGVHWAYTDLKINSDFTLDQLTPFLKSIYKKVESNQHFPSEENETGIPYEEYPRWSVLRYILSWFSPSNWRHWFSNKKRFSVPDGKVGLIRENGRPRFVNSGEYILLGSSSEFEKAVDSKLIERHGTTRIIRVAKHELYYVENKTLGCFNILLPGTHILKNSNELDIQPIITPYGNTAVIRKTQSEIDQETAALNAKRTKIRNDDQEEKKQTPKSISEFRTLFVNIAQGNIGIVYNSEGTLTIWEAGRYYLPPQWHFHCIFSTKQGDLTFKTTPSLRIQDNFIDMEVTGELTYEFEEKNDEKPVRIAIQAKGINHVLDTIKSIAAEATKNKLSQATYTPTLDSSYNSSILVNLNNNAQLKELGIKIIKFAIKKVEPADEYTKKVWKEKQAEAVRQMPVNSLLTSCYSGFYTPPPQQPPQYSSASASAPPALPTPNPLEID